MVNHALRTLYRSLNRHRLYAALNVFGLALGVAVFLVLALDVRFETSFERWIPRAQSIYVIRTSFTMPGFPGLSSDNTMGAILEELTGDYPQLTGTFVRGRSLTILQGGEATRADVAFVGPSFFRVFDLPMVSGDKRRLLRTPDEIVISARIAKQYFPSGDSRTSGLAGGLAGVLGRTLTVSSNGVVRDYRVSGVLKDLPANTDRTFDLIARMTPDMISGDDGWRRWDGIELATYLVLKGPFEAAALNADLDRFVDRHASLDLHRRDAHTVVKVRAEPLLGRHLSDANLSRSVLTLGAVGLIALLMAGVNYVNLATARAEVRAKEVALRKVAGATNRALVLQFMFEALVVALMGTLLGLALAETALPMVNAVTGLSLKIVYLGGQSVLPLLCAVVLIIGLGAGVYPALALTRFQPAGVLTSARNAVGGLKGVMVREALVTVQFVAATLFIISTAVIFAEVRLLHQGDVGFDQSRLILVESFSDPYGRQDVTASQRSTLLDLWRKIPSVLSVTTSDATPSARSSRRFSNFLRPGMTGGGVLMTAIRTGPDFSQTYGLRLKAGRFLKSGDPGDRLVPSVDPALGEAAEFAPVNVMVNTNAAHALGFTSPRAAIGQTILEKAGPKGEVRREEIAGVVENARFVSPREAIPACVYYLQTSDIPNAAATVRYDGARPKAVLDQLHALWRRIVPGAPFHAEGLETSRQEYYKSEVRQGRLFGLGAGLAVIVGCLGLYGLASSTAERRTREIGVRKTLGASTGDIVRLLLGQFMRPVLIATCVAWPLAYLAMKTWLSSFDQRIELTPIYFLGATFLALVIAMATVTGQAISVARSEPAKALRYE